MAEWTDLESELTIDVDFASAAPNRRAEPRYAAAAVPAITDVKTASGNPLTLVNISSSGALVEGNARIKPGERVTLVMEGLEPKQVPGRVVRSIVTAIAGTGTLRFQTGIAFDQRIRLPLPASPLGSFTLLAPDRMLFAARCSSPMPNGEFVFNEDREGPPSRAYLKLWEGLTRHRLEFGSDLPTQGDICLDLGSSPGGWTWVLQSLGARVISVDKAPLAPGIAALPNVDFMRTSAFALAPADIGPVDWLCSDVVCYPARLLALVERWLESGMAHNFVCTLKFQGATDHATARRFSAIPGSRLLHLHHNKHELTWLKLA